MRTVLLTIFLIADLACATLRGNDGGGGKGVLCEHQGIRTIQSLDLYEAKSVWGYSIPQEDFKASVRRVGFRYWSSLYEQPDEKPTIDSEGLAKQTEQFFVDYFVNMMKFIPRGSRLKLTEDANLIVEPPPDCKLVQVIVYVDEGPDTGSIIVDREYWDLLDGQNQLSFYFHEIMYKAYRHFGNARNSDAIRKWVGALFASAPFPSRNGAVRKSKKALRCETEAVANQGSPYSQNARFFVTPIENSNEFYAQTYVYFQFLGNFGKLRAPLEHKAVSWVGYDSFLGSSSSVVELENTTPLKIHSIVGGLELAIIEKRKCLGTRGCVDLYLAQRLQDGRVLQEKINCQEIQVIQE